MVLWPLGFTVICHGMEQGAGMLHTHTLTALLPAMLYISIVFIYYTRTLWISSFLGGEKQVPFVLSLEINQMVLWGQMKENQAAARQREISIRTETNRLNLTP